MAARQYWMDETGTHPTGRRLGCAVCDRRESIIKSAELYLRPTQITVGGFHPDHWERSMSAGSPEPNLASQLI